MFSFTHELPPVLEAAPLDWQSFKCPEISCGLLSRVHRHLRDQRISFTAGNHTYHVDGKKVSISVTGLVHFFAEEFDADAAIACMKRSQNWPREAYAKVVDGKLQPLPDAEIKELWRKNSVEASARGTWMQIEVFLNGGCSENPGVEIDLFAKFLQQFPTRLLAFRTEWCIYAENEDLAGCVDFVAALTEAGEVVLFDWKRTKLLRDKYNNPWSCMKKPLSHIPDCAGQHYRLQLNVYKYILQQYYEMRVAGMYVVCLHPDNADLGPFIDEVPDMAPEVHAMLQSRARSTAPPAWQDLSGGAEADSQTSFGRQIEDELEMQVDDDNARRSLEEAFAAGLVFDAARSVSQGNLVPSEEDIFRDAKKRRCMPGAETTMARLQEIFQNSDESCAESFLSMPPAVQRIHDRTIVQQKKTYLALVSQRHPTWPETVQHLAAAALTCYRTRLSDMFVRDYVALLWVMEGDRFLRAHNGTCYLYHEHGAFQAFVGMPPESTFSRVKPFLLQLEGMFRLMSSRVERSDYCLLDEIARLFDEHNSACEFLNRCLDEAIMTAGTRSTSRRQMNRLEAPERGVDAPAEAPAGTPSWPLFTADMISRVAAPLQRDLLEERKLLQYVAQWCDTPTQRRPGVAYTDCCVLYDVSPEHNVQLVNASPDLNIYIRVPHPLRAHALEDPVFRQAKDRLEKFLRETFWCNEDFLRACMSALALAKRGENVDRCFIGESPGGTGQSLYSCHIAAVYARNHAFIDTAVFLNEDELRKQLEGFAHCFILTAQEAPESNRAFLQDVFKKVCSADDLAARRPYGFVTRMMRCIGWKRYETNVMLQFRNVQERNFNSMFRRCLVWEPKPLFWEQKTLEESYPDAHMDGIFAKDTTLKEFLESGPAIAVSLHVQHGFEVRHSRQDCRDIIEQMVVQGPTEKKVRAACGLEDRKQEGGSSSATALAHLVRSATTVQDANEDASAECLHERVRNAMISYGLNTRGTPATKLKFSKAWWTRYSSSKIGNRTLTLDVLQDKKMVIFAGGAGDKGNVSQSFVPIIPALPNVYDHMLENADKENPESSTLHHLWTVVEDRIIDAWLEKIAGLNPRHVSLHFDGIRVDTSVIGDDVENFCAQCSDHIAEKTGFKITIRPKLHRHFLEELRSKRGLEEVPCPEELEEPGNCILRSLHHLGYKAQALAMATDVSSEFHQYFRHKHHRTYAQVSERTGLFMNPTFAAASTPFSAGQKKLMHLHTQGDPHCVALEVVTANEFIITDEKKQYRVSSTDFLKCLKAAVDSKYIVLFDIFGSEAEANAAQASNTDDALTATEMDSLRCLHAAGEAQDDDFVVDMEEATDAEEPPEESEDEGIVRVGDRLLSSLKNEVTQLKAECIPRSDGEYRCPFCPWRSWAANQSKKRVLDHVEKYHDHIHQFVASGTKQLKLIISLHDAAQCTGSEQGDLLTRSAEMLRCTVQPAVCASTTSIDRHIRLVFTERGPEFWNAVSVQEFPLRRVRNLYYTYEFGQIVYQQFLLSDAKARFAAGELFADPEQM